MAPKFARASAMGSLTFGFFLVSSAWAQDDSVALEEVVVTAQKREQNLQDVPLAVTAMTADQLEVRGIESLYNLNALGPNVLVRQNPGAKLISTVGIRGSVTGQPAIWIDPNVGLYLDGIYLGKAQGSVFEVVDIERVEVLRGPQGTLFGRNTEGGAINFITRKPSGELRGSAGVEFGNFSRKIGRLMMDLPKFGIASVSLGARTEDADGWANNLTGPDLGAIDSQAYRASAKLDFNENFSAIYDFDYSKAYNTPNPSSLLALSGWSGTFPSVFGAATQAGLAFGRTLEAALTPFVQTSRPDTVSTNGPPSGLYEQQNNNAHALTLDWSLNEQNELKYIYAHRRMRFSDSQDIDGTPLDSIYGGYVKTHANYNRRTRYEQESHELQWTGNAQPFNWVLGLYYFEDDGVTNGAQDFSIFSQPFQRSDYGAATKAKAIYGQADWTLGERWTLTAGARYTRETRDGFTHRYITQGFDGAFVTDQLAPGAICPRDTCTIPLTSYSATFSGTQPVGKLSFRLNPDVMFYASVAKGFKSGGFSSELAGTAGSLILANPYQPQSSLSKEIGVKSELFDRRAIVNFAVFDNKVKDLQLTQLLPGTTQSFLTNAGEATYRGAELEAQVLIADGWRLQGSWGYLDAEFDKYIDRPILCFTGLGGPVCVPNSAGALRETAGNRLPPYAPEHTLNVTLDGRLWELRNSTELRLILDYMSQSETFLYTVNKSLTAPDAGGQYLQTIDDLPAIRNLNARLLLADVPFGNATADFSIFVRNVTDEDKQIQGIDFSMFRNAGWQEPRTYMFTMNFKW